MFIVGLFFTIGGSCRARPQDPEPPLSEPGAPPLPGPLQGQEGEEPQLKVYISETGSVVEMGMEEYITGVVAAEMDPNWHEEALAAQAIIARSFTLQKISESGGVPQRGAHASTNIEEFQAYDAEQITDNVRKAVEMTRGKVAVYNNDYIRGWFHAYAGPRTAQADEGLEFAGGNPPYIQIVESPGGNVVPQEEGDWEASFSLTEVRAKVQEITGDDPGPVEEIEVAETGPSGRATTILVNGLEVSAPSLRLALGSTEMRSTFIEDISVEEDKMHLSGTGYGHGVGMCQWGAKALAEDGRNSEEIVNYYYRNIEIVQAWE